MPGRLTPPMPERLAPQWRISALTSVPSAWPGRRMDDEPGRLVDDDQVLVLVDDGERHVLAGERRILGRRRLEGDRAPAASRVDGSRATRAVDADFAGLDQRLEPGARKRDASRGRRGAQEPVEPLAGALRADVEDLLALGRSQADAQERGLRRRVCRYPARGGRDGSEARCFAFAFTRRSRRRVRWRRLGGGRRDRGPSAATIASTSGRAPGFAGVERAPHRRDMGRRVAAAAADDAGAAIDGEPGVGRHQLRRAGIMDMRAMPLRHAGVGLGDDGAPGRARSCEDRDQEIGGADAAIGAEGERRGLESLGQDRRTRRARGPSSCGRRCRSSR